MKKYLLLFSCLFIFGFGCNQEMPVEPLADPEPPVVQKQPRQADPLDAVYKYCEDNGNTVVLQFDAQSKQSRALCVFSNNTQCNALQYMQGSCGPNNGAKVFTNTGNDIEALIRTCTTADPVVCGSDGRNYTNRCVAELQRIRITHDGVCTAEEQAETFVPSDPLPVATITEPSAAQGASGSPSPTTPSQTAVNEPPQWLAILYQMILTRDKAKPPATVEQCSIDNETFYLYTDAFSVLYTEQGSVYCFPKNDATGICPEQIKPQHKAAFCKEIWRDKR